MSNKTFRAAMAKVVMGRPFFASILLTLDVIEDPTERSLKIDGKTLTHSPTFFEGKTLEEAEYAICQNAMHVALGHHFRMAGRDPERWNEACDHAVNQDLAVARVRLPAGALLDTRFRGKTAEAIYEILQREAEQKKQEQPQQSQGGQGSPDGGQGAPQPSDEQGQGQPSPIPQSESQSGRIEAPSFADAAERAEAEAKLQETVATAAQAARAAGNLPGSVDRALQPMLSPRVDWREALRRWFYRKTRDDTSWSRRGRRSTSTYILPGRLSDAPGVFAVAVDLSGSISRRQVEAFSSELQALREEIRPERTIVIYFDYVVRKVDDLGPFDPISLSVRGGGGTNFQAAQRWLENEGILPDALVYLTDLEAPAGAAPDYPVLWASCSGDSEMPYGEVVSII